MSDFFFFKAEVTKAAHICPLFEVSASVYYGIIGIDDMLCKAVHVYSITVGCHRYLKEMHFDKTQNLFQNIMCTQTHVLVVLNNIPDPFQKIK